MLSEVSRAYWREYWQRPGKKDMRREYNRRYREKLKGLLPALPDPPAGYIKLRAAGHEIGYAVKWLRSLIRMGRVPGIKIGRLWYVNVDALRAYARRMCYWRVI